MLTTSPLREVRRWDNSEELSVASEKYFAKVGRNNILYVRELNGPWHAVADLGPCRSGSTHAEARFTNDDSLVVTRCEAVQLIRADGQISFSMHAPKGRGINDAWASPNGRFVAAPTTTLGGLKIAEAFDMSSGRAPRRILVYDTKSGSPVASIKYTWVHQCAFSPDSSALAVLSGGIMQLYSLPRVD